MGGLILGAILDAHQDRVPPGYGWIDTDVRPQDTRVFVDGAFVGVTDQLDGRPDLLYLPPGRYRATGGLTGKTDRKFL